MPKIIFFDFEVFIHNWMVVFIEHESKVKNVIIDNTDELKTFYDSNKDNIFCGYNSRNYDQYIFKGILKGMNPFSISKQMIEEDKKGYHIVTKSNEIPFINFDVSTGFHSLKQLEGFMGSKIKESSVPFDIDRKLTEEEIQEVLEYCTHDVEQTIEVFNKRREEFDSQLSLIEAFDLPMEMFNKTKAQLSAHILGTERKDGRDDEFKLTIPDTLRISEKYQYIVEWYKNPINMNYKKSLIVNVANVPHVFAWGGLHGALPNYIGDGIILCLDVASLYPSIMIEYGFLSRNVTEQGKYREIRDTRLRLKAEKNPKQAPLKIVLNSTYGAMKDKQNALYDPLMANNVCIAGQLLLLDLIEKIEDHCELIQSNTDGLFLKVKDMETVDLIKSAAKEWETRTRLDLEWDIFSKIYQKDVNNYIIINAEGKYKSKGAYVKKLNDIDYDLPIVNKALIDYFVYNKPVEETIVECNQLREFQKIVKISKLYNYALHGDNRINEKVLRVFASNDPLDAGVFKVKGEDKIEKLANTPECCFIYNDEVNAVDIVSKLDKNYYVEVATKRLSDFIDEKLDCKIKVQASDIKFINIDIKTQCLESIERNYLYFVNILKDLRSKTDVNYRQLKILIQLDYFKKFGKGKALIEILKYFELLKDGDSKQITIEKIDNSTILAIMSRFSKPSPNGKKLLISNCDAILSEIEEYVLAIETEDYTVMERIMFHDEYYGFINFTTNKEEDKRKLLILTIKELVAKASNKTWGYCCDCVSIGSGKTSTLNIWAKTYDKNPVKKYDFVYANKVDKNEKGYWYLLDYTKTEL